MQSKLNYLKFINFKKFLNINRNFFDSLADFEYLHFVLI